MELRKDALGQDIEVGSIIVWGNSSRYAGIEQSVVVSYNPKLLRTSGGSNVDAKQCCVVTEQLKITDPVKANAMIEAARPKFIALEDTKQKAIKKHYKVFVTFIGENAMPASGKRTYKDFKLEVEVYHDGKLVGTQAPYNVPNYMYQHKYIVRRAYESISKYRSKRNGKLELTDRCYHGKKSDYELSGKLVKALLGDIPTKSFSENFNTASELLNVLDRVQDFLKVDLKDKYSSNKNSLGEALEQEQ